MITDIFNHNIEILGSALIHPESKTLHQQYVNMTEEESKEFAEKTMSELTGDLLTDTLLYLSLFTNGRCLAPHYDRIISKGIFYPGAIYLHADARIAQKLIQIIEEGRPNVRVNDLLICLAWIGTPNVAGFFSKATKLKPKWTEELFVTPLQYAEEASWTLDSAGKRRNLFSERIIPLSSAGQAGALDTIRTFVPHADHCSWCSNKLTTVFKTPETEFTTCLLCSCFGALYMKLNGQGKSSWHPKNAKPEFLPVDREITVIPENSLKVAAEHRLPSYTISPSTYNTRSQIGGYPTWIQDAEHLNCPDCAQKMNYTGQFDTGEAEPAGDGIYYFHHCPDCKTTGTSYQQT
jgi:hypothetical protein